MPLVSHGLLASTGPKNISYIRKVSAPYLSIKSFGLTVLYFDLDIFSTSTPQMYLPSSKINSALLYSSLQFLKVFIFSSTPSTKFTSTLILWIAIASGVFDLRSSNEEMEEEYFL